jgi:hypothetical protein
VNLVNYASLVTTNAARHRYVSGKKKVLLEFGLRRAQVYTTYAFYLLLYKPSSTFLYCHLFILKFCRDQMVGLVLPNIVILAALMQQGTVCSYNTLYSFLLFHLLSVSFQKQGHTN